ncbi:hypothetical protein FR943_17890 [Mycobacterium sp. TNTM28]|uniref:Uncharacterized protein n=1 Tax=[Mycobacterium] fortunisiensis TaxID=2600579 RepID=A0ABS6KQ08_9MYCO|nr:hypothetical protein [[Mycobacterium] fortunisiensis]MBU9765708.1 hypothetical protein [[Mycobacterium] fortunisiensis]
MTLFSTRTRRFVAVGAFALATGAAAAAPAFLATPAADPQMTAGPACLAWFGNKEDGKCLSYSNGTPAQVGTPWVGAGGNGGFVTGPLLPGTTINQGIG